MALQFSSTAQTEWISTSGTLATDLAVSEDPVHLYPSSGTYMVNLTVTKGGCTKTCPGKVEVRPVPDCSWTSSSPICNGTVVQFSSPAGMDSYSWDFGDGQVSSAQGASHLYSAPGTYTVNSR